MRVPRRTADRANDSVETSPRTIVPDPEASARLLDLRRRLVGPCAMMVASLASPDRTVLLSSTD